MPSLTHNMRTRLSCILYDYQTENELNAYTDDHINHCTFILNRREVITHLSPYKLDIQLAIDYHKEHVRDFPKNTYNKLTKIIEEL